MDTIRYLEDSLIKAKEQLLDPDILKEDSIFIIKTILIYEKELNNRD